MVFYVFTILGVVLLWRDIAGNLVAEPSGLQVRRAVGMFAAAITGLTPLLLWKLDRIVVGPPFEFFASAYLVALTIYLLGLLVRPQSATSRWLSRIGYAALLALASLPSFVLIVLAAPAALAGIGLTRELRGRPAAA
jgi:hypothetical protein